jgi:hypothetical protein
MIEDLSFMTDEQWTCQSYIVIGSCCWIHVDIRCVEFDLVERFLAVDDIGTDRSADENNDAIGSMLSLPMPVATGRDAIVVFIVSRMMMMMMMMIRLFVTMNTNDSHVQEQHYW